jgi:hypothetical protein
VIFTRKKRGILLDFFGEQSKQSQGQSDSDGALSSFSLFTFRYPSNDGVLRMVDSQGDYLIISKCNEELSPHHHSEAVRIGFLRIKRTVIWRTGQFSCIVTVYRGEQAEVLQLLPISHAKLTTALENGAGTR